MSTLINGQEAVDASIVGEIAYFCKPTAVGTGDGLSWDNACTFRTAVSKCTGTSTTTIYLGGGLHDTDNGSDATGTTISVANVFIKGFHAPGAIGQASRLINSAAAVTTVLKVTGNYCTIEGVDFDNSDQTDKNIVLLEVAASYVVISDCLFRQLAGDPGGTGIAYTAGVSLTINNCRFRRCVDYGVNVVNAGRLYAYSNKFAKCGKGIYLSNANSDQTFWNSTEFLGCTTGIDGIACPTKEHYFIDATFANCTTNVADFAAYASGFWFENVKESGLHRSVYPLTAAGAQITKNANSYTWGTVQQVIPKDTLLKPFLLQAINIQAWSAAQTYYIEIYYGETTGTTSCGVYEVTLGATGGSKVPVAVLLNVYVPARAYVGARIMTSTDASDDITFCLGYELL